MVLFQIRTSASRLSPSPPARPPCVPLSPPGSPRPRRPRRRPPCGRVATRASAPRDTQVDRRASLASSETRLSVASPRGVRPRPHAVASPPSSGIARRTSGRDVASRASSLAGWTHGFGDADSGPVDGAAMPPSPSPTRLGFSRLVALCAASFAAALLAQHVFTWPGLAAVAPAAAFATGNLGVATNAFPAVIVSALTKTAALVAARRGTRGFARRRRRRRRTPPARRATRRRRRRRRRWRPCAPSSPSCASPSRTPRRRRNARPPTVRAAAPRRRRRSTRFPATRRRVVGRFFSTRRASRAPSRAKDGRLGTRASQRERGLRDRTHRTPRSDEFDGTHEPWREGREGSVAVGFGFDEARARGGGRRKNEKSAQNERALRAPFGARSVARVRELEALEWCRPHRRG